MYTLGIETSCDETSVAILHKRKILSNVTISSLNEHKKYGGVVPEIATRAHLKNLDKVFKVALHKAKIPLRKINLISVANKPGLLGALVVGLNFAKGLSLALGRPLIGVNHLHAHIFSPFLDSSKIIPKDLLGVVISGGHTQIYKVNDFYKMSLVGSTRDDACGEVFDKIAVNYGLGYPGGPVIDKRFNLKHAKDFSFKCGKIGLDLSFSGIKTALIYKRAEMEKKKQFNSLMKTKLVSSFQYSVFQTLVATIKQAAQKYGVKSIAFGGGVMANNYLRLLLDELKTEGFSLYIPSKSLCSDNAAIVAGLGFYLYNKNGIEDNISLKAAAN